MSEDEPSDGGRAVYLPDLANDPPGAGDHPSVVPLLDNVSVADPFEAVLGAGAYTWHTRFGVLTSGARTGDARLRIDSMSSDVVARSFTVTQNLAVEWQVVDRDAAPDSGAWRTASGVENWAFTFDTASDGAGERTILVRVVDHGVEVARDSARVTFG